MQLMMQSHCKADHCARAAPTSSAESHEHCFCRADPPCLQSWLKDASNTFKGIDGPFSAGYAALTAGLLGAGIGYIVAPGLTLGGVSQPLAMHHWQCTRQCIDVKNLDM